MDFYSRFNTYRLLGTAVYVFFFTREMLIWFFGIL